MSNGLIGSQRLTVINGTQMTNRDALGLMKRFTGTNWGTKGFKDVHGAFKAFIRIRTAQIHKVGMSKSSPQL